MFTGIIQHVGRVAGVISTSAGRRLTIDAGPLADRLQPAASLAVDGACLTVISLRPPEVQFDVVPETLSRTTLGTLGAGSKVNLEPPLAAGAPLDGHLVQGHVDGQAEVARVERGPAGWMLHLRAGEDLTQQMVPKGSVALAGVSLTLVTVRRDGFCVALIPATLQRTTLGQVGPGDRLNVESDIIGKYVMRYLQGLPGKPAGLTMEQLRRGGFV